MKRILAILLAALLCLPMSYTAFAEEPADNSVVKTWLFIEGIPDGPSVAKIITELAQDAASVEAEGLTLVTAGTKHEVGPAYLCDGNGNPTDGPSNYVAFDVGETISDGESSGFDPFSGSVFSRDESAISVWAETYQVQLNAEKFLLDGAEAELAVDENCIGNRICPDAALYEYRNTFTGTYRNNYTGEEEEITLHLAAYEPEAIAGGEKNPLIIWLHGQGEAGTDPDIAILGNEVSALAKDPIQSYFTAGEEIGAYVLIPQCKTYWMDEGDGTNGEGCGVSRYTEILKDTIDFYLQENPDVDTGRIYIGGCSNGGYMTVNMLVNYPEMFAAAYPLCEAYSYYLFERDENGNYVVYQEPQENGGESEGDSAGDSEGDSEGNSESSEDSADSESAENEDPLSGVSEGVTLRENENAEIIATKTNGEILSNEGLYLTEDKIAKLVNIPIWFASSADDFTVALELYPLPTFVALLQAGHENCWFSLMSGYGHGVWSAFFQDLVNGVQDNEAYKAVEIPAVVDATPFAYPLAPGGADSGGDFDANGFTNIFEWMNAQSR